MNFKVNPGSRIRVNGFYETFSYVKLGNGAFCQRIVIIIWVYLLLKLTLNEEFNMTAYYPPLFKDFNPSAVEAQFINFKNH